MSIFTLPLASLTSKAPKRGRCISLLACAALMCTLAAGCSDDDNTSQPLSDASVEDTGDVGSDTDTRDVSDVGSDTDTGDAGDAIDVPDTADADEEPIDGFSPELLGGKASSLKDFKSVDERYGVDFSGGSSANGVFEGASFGFLYDLADPDDIQLSDTLIVESGYLFGTAVDGRVVAGWAGLNDEDEWEITATSYDVSQGSFDPIDEIDVPAEVDRSCRLLDVVTNQEAIALVCYERFIELRMDEQGGLELVDWTETRGGSPPAFISQRAQQYEMTPDGHILEMADELNIWRLPSMLEDAAPGDDDPATYVGSFSPEKMDRVNWVYRPDLNLIYTCGAYSSTDITRRPGYVIDVSDATAPGVVSQWDALDDFGGQAGMCEAGASSGDLLFFRYASLLGPTRALWSFDISADPHNLASLELQELRDIPGSTGSARGGLAIHGDFLIYGAYPPQASGLDLVAIPLSYFEQE